MTSRADIKKQVKKLHQLLWRNRHQLWAKPPHPREMLDPRVAAKALGIKTVESPTLGSATKNGRKVQIAGVIDREQQTIYIASQLDEATKRFTLAHELGHWLLHDDLIAHRDLPMDGTKAEHNAIEREANAFATQFLMPENLLRREFEESFGGQSITLDEDTAFRLSIDNDKLSDLQSTSLGEETQLARQSHYAGNHFISLSERFHVSASAMAIRLRELALIAPTKAADTPRSIARANSNTPAPRETPSLTVVSSLPPQNFMPATRQGLQNINHPETLRLVVLQHGLRDTRSFLNDAQAARITVGGFVAKPNSARADVLSQIKAMGIPVVEEPEGTFPPYDYFENSDCLYKLVYTEAVEALAAKQKLVLVDVGGYFCQPLIKLPEALRPAIAGVVEVTTFGHKRYQANRSELPVPIISIARSPIKFAEAVYVGDAVLRATEDMFQHAGHSFIDKQFGMIGYGMIGAEIARAARGRQQTVHVSDLDAQKRLTATVRNYKTCDLATLLQVCDVIFSATGGQAVTVDHLREAKDGIVLISGGSRANEFDVQGIEMTATHSRAHGDFMAYTMPWGKTVVVANQGKAANFIKDATPEDIMDIVFAEITAAIDWLSRAPLPCGQVNEVPQAQRDTVIERWEAIQKKPLFKR